MVGVGVWFNSEPNKRLRLTPPLAPRNTGIGVWGLWLGFDRVERVDRVERFGGLGLKGLGVSLLLKIYQLKIAEEVEEKRRR